MPLLKRHRTTTSSGPKTLLVAATGGHLEQLFRLRHRFDPASAETHWVTHDDPQSRSLLADESVSMVPYVPPRGYGPLARVMPKAWSILREGRFDRIISTGAGIAIPFLSLGRLLRVDCHYVESAARADGPSMSGKIVGKVPGVHLYSQYERWADSRWKFQGSLFDSFEVIERDPTPIRRVVVTLGTMRTYEFRRAVDRLLTVLPEALSQGADVLWQVGVTDGSGLTGDVRSNVPNAELRDRIESADLVIAHSGIGSAITALELGKRPVLLPRSAALGEHVDDHQRLIAGELSRRDLAVMAEADQVSVEDLVRASAGRVVDTKTQLPFVLRSTDAR